jgi:hypothetical protein
MTEKTLYRRTLIVLGSTIVAPLFVAVTGVGLGSGAGSSVASRVTHYLRGSAQPAVSTTQTSAPSQSVSGQAAGDTKARAVEGAAGATSTASGTQTATTSTTEDTSDTSPTALPDTSGMPE